MPLAFPFFFAVDFKINRVIPIRWSQLGGPNRAVPSGRFDVNSNWFKINWKEIFSEFDSIIIKFSCSVCVPFPFFFCRRYQHCVYLKCLVLLGRESPVPSCRSRNI